MEEGTESGPQVVAEMIRTWESDLANFPWLTRKLPARAEAVRLWRMCHLGKLTEAEIVDLIGIEPKQAAVLAAFAKRFPEYRVAITCLLRWRREVLSAFRALQAGEQLPEWEGGGD